MNSNEIIVLQNKLAAAVHYANEIADHANKCGVVSSPAFELSVARVREIRERDTPIPGLLRDLAEARLRVELVTRERDEARSYGERMYRDAAFRRVTCVYCGHHYPDGTPATQDERLSRHIEVCEKHPMRAVIAERDQACAKAERMLGVLKEARARLEPNRNDPELGNAIYGQEVFCARIDDVLRECEGKPC